MHTTTQATQFEQALQHLKGAAKPMTLGAFITELDHTSFGLLLILVAIPSGIPLVASGLSIPLGCIIVAIGWQILIGRKYAALPKRAARIHLGPKSLRRMARCGLWCINWSHGYIRPRCKWLLEGRMSHLCIGITVCTLGLITALPIPLVHTVPAIVLLTLGLGLIQDDGLVVAVACVLGWLAIIAYSILLYVVSIYGWHVLHPA